MAKAPRPDRRRATAQHGGHDGSGGVPGRRAMNSATHSCLPAGVSDAGRPSCQPSPLAVGALRRAKWAASPPPVHPRIPGYWGAPRRALIRRVALRCRPDAADAPLAGRPAPRDPTRAARRGDRRAPDSPPTRERSASDAAPGTEVRSAGTARGRDAEGADRPTQAASLSRAGGRWRCNAPAGGP